VKRRIRWAAVLLMIVGLASLGGVATATAQSQNRGFGIVMSRDIAKSTLEIGGRVYHVQTQTADRTEPVIETLIYEGGEVAVRMTASLESLAAKWHVSARDIPRLLALQHWDMIHKVKRGMLDGESAGPPPPPTARQTVQVERVTAVTIEEEDPRVREVLDELDAKLDVLTMRDPSRESN